MGGSEGLGAGSRRDDPEADFEIEIEPSKVAHGGVFVGRHEGRVVFVSDAVDGERVRARVTDRRRERFWRAETLEVLEPSEHRREHVWEAASLGVDPARRAGGAEFGHIFSGHQRELKRRVLVESLERLGRLTPDTTADLAVEEVDGARADGTGWRTRVRLHVDDSGRVGPYAARSRRVVPVRTLPLATDEVVAAAPLAELLPEAAAVDVVSASSGVEVVTVPRRRARRRVPTVRERVGDREFVLDADGFWQVHVGAPRALTGAVRWGIGEHGIDPQAENLDLYGGVGLLAAAVADHAGHDVRLTSVEGGRRASGHARDNLADLGSVRTVCLRVDRYLSGTLERASAADRARMRASTVVLDPPRSGAGGAVVDALTRWAPRRMVYVACDPVALARDLADLGARGYTVIGLRAFDLFPHTHHVEAVAVLERDR